MDSNDISKQIRNKLINDKVHKIHHEIPIPDIIDAGTLELKIDAISHLEFWGNVNAKQIIKYFIRDFLLAKDKGFRLQDGTYSLFSSTYQDLIDIATEKHSDAYEKFALKSSRATIRSFIDNFIGD